MTSRQAKRKKQVSSQRSAPQAFERLVKERKRAVIFAASFLLVIFSINILLMTVAANTAGQPITPDGATTVGVAYSIFLIVSGAATAAAYTFWSNVRIDSLVRQARKELGAEE